MRAYVVPDHPAIRRAERYGMDEPELLGWCERCGEEIYEGQQYGTYEDMLFCDETCFHRWIGFEVVL